ncbi:MAG: porphobilinogen synthase, partial [Candidatus Binatia bacterium]
MAYPRQRLRRLRSNSTLRRMVRETGVGVDDLIQPYFVCPGRGIEREVAAMPGVFQQSVDKVVESASRSMDLGIPAVLLFGIPVGKDARGSEALEADGVVQTAVGAIKKAAPDLQVITDVCLCEYTDHGHCGVLEGEDVANDATVELLAAAALSHARAGADLVAPSDMMDGRVEAIRDTLDEH